MLPDTSPTGQWRGMPWWEPMPKRFASEPCPTCRRPAARYDRPLTNTMALKLIHLHQLHLRHPDRKSFHVGEFDLVSWIGNAKGVGRGEFGTLSNWAVVEEAPKKPKSGGSTNGCWSITEFGRSFVHGNVQVPTHVMLTFGSRLLGFCGRMRKIKELLKKENRFSYEDLVSATVEQYQQLTLDRMFRPKAM